MKKIAFLTGTRADFGKIKSLISATKNTEGFEPHIFVTGMHMNKTYGLTVDEVRKSGFTNIYSYINHDNIEYMDRTLAKTIEGFSQYVKQIEPDLIVVHGDRVEALAGAIVGSLNNILVAHIEGGEVSGTIDELIRHSVSKMSHIHLVANRKAKDRLIQLGELKSSIHIIGSPDLDLMNVNSLPDLEKVLNYYDIPFADYSIAMFHPVTTEYGQVSQQIQQFVESLVESDINYILIYPNNDIGSSEIIKAYKDILSDKIKIFPSLRFESFLTLLKNSKFIIGNSSAGIREAPHYNLPTINIGTRQNKRADLPSIINCGYQKREILEAIKKVKNIIETGKIHYDKYHFGTGDSSKKFIKLITSSNFWSTDYQKSFQEIKYES